jgi:hypothetical protein
VDARLLVDCAHERRLLALVGEKSSAEVKFEALGNVVVKLDLGAEDVGGGPSLSEDEAVLLVEVLGLDITRDRGRLGVTDTRNLEGCARRGEGLHLERGAVDGEVLAEQVVAALAKVLGK